MALYRTSPINCHVLYFQEAGNVGNITEVDLNTRFLFIVLGPRSHLGHCAEMCRCMATLFTDEVCRVTKYAYLFPMKIINSLRICYACIISTLPVFEQSKLPKSLHSLPTENSVHLSVCLRYNYYRAVL